VRLSCVMLCLHNVALTCCVCYRLCVLLQRARMKCDKWRASILTRTDLWVNQPHAECSAGTNSETWLNRNRHSICDSRRGPMFNPGMRGQRIVARDLDLRSANSVLPSTRISKQKSNTEISSVAKQRCDVTVTLRVTFTDRFG
jgi:hypothetical protein